MDRPWARVPDWVGPALRPELSRCDGGDHRGGAGRRAGVRAAARRPVRAADHRGRVGGARTSSSTCSASTPPPVTCGSTAALGQLEHREGRTLAALQSAYQVGTRTAWRRIAGSSAARQLPPDVIFALAEALFTYVEQLGAASVAGWAYEDARNAGSRADPPARARRTARPAAARVGGRGGAGGRGRGVAAARTAGGAGRRGRGGRGGPAARCGRGRTSTRSGSRWCPCRNGPCPGRTGWCDRVRIAVRDRPAVLGPVVALGRAGRSVARAQAAWPLHVAGLLGTRPTGLVRADEHLLALLLAAEPELAADLCERALAPLRALPAGCRGAGRADAARVARRARRRLRGGRDPARAPADGALPAGRRCARRSATRWTTRRPAWSWRSRCG